MKTGRNDPCPCGSGQKYKKCCLEKKGAPRDAQRERDDLRATAFGSVLRFASRPQFNDARDAAYDAFAQGGDDGDLGDGDEPLDEDVHAKFSFFYLFDYLLPDGRTLAQTFLERTAWQVDARARALIERFGRARLRLYEVEEVRVDEGLRLRDLWSDREVFVSERAGTRQLTRWDLLAARVVLDEDGAHRLEGGLYLLPSRMKRPLLDAIRAEADRLGAGAAVLDEDRLFRNAAAIVHRFWLDHVVHRPLPQVVTAEGDRMEFGGVVFDVLDRQAVEAALDQHAEIVAEGDGTWAWLEESDDGFTRSLGRISMKDDRLVLEVTSRARGARGRRLLERAAGDAIRYRSARYQDVRAAMARSHGAREAGDGGPAISIDPEEAAALILDYKRRHYSIWPDEPLPALDGRTPREAAASAPLRPRLVDLLKEMENMEARGARPDSPAFDFGSVWQELGLERPV